MKLLLITILGFCFYSGFAQQQTGIEKLLKKYTLDVKKQFISVDSILANRVSSDKQKQAYNRKLSNGVIPNAITANAYPPKLIGNNGNGQNIYILPLDKMTMITPDSTYASTMPVAGITVQAH
jgi:hypothetical protein